MKSEAKEYAHQLDKLKKDHATKKTNLNYQILKLVNRVEEFIISQQNHDKTIKSLIEDNQRLEKESTNNWKERMTSEETCARVAKEKFALDAVVASLKLQLHEIEKL